MSRLNAIKSIGPGALVTAAFIGPGTVTACTLAGANFGFALLWALVFATLATLILQDMAARLGIITRQGLGENLRAIFETTPWKWPLFILITVALYVGNAAYEAGNLSGAALGIMAVAPETPALYKGAVIAIALLAATLLLSGSYKIIERILILLVCIMALAFVATFIAVRPDLGAMMSSALIPTVPRGSLMTVIALIGTTVVPYNLFLHASAVKHHSMHSADARTMRLGSASAIGLGGVITILIASTAATALFGAGITVNGVGDMAVQLEPVFGSFSRIMLGVGFFAAGLTSSVTAPLATAYAMTEIFGIKGGTASVTFKTVALSVIAIGAALALTGIKPVTIILSAQFANGLLLPIIAIFLLVVMNRASVLGTHVNGRVANILGGAVVITTSVLGARLIGKALGVL